MNTEDDPKRRCPRCLGQRVQWSRSVGWERSLKEWAIEQGWNGRRVSQEAASGILIAALGALEAHFGMARDCDMSIS